MKLKKLISASLAILLFATNCLFAYSHETNVWEERRKSFQVASTAAPFFPARIPLTSAPLAQSIPFRFRSSIPASDRSVIEHISYSLGSVREVSHPSTGPSNKIVVMVQDIHMNAEAQKNISAMLTSFSKDVPLDFVALEGTHKKINVERYRKSTRPEILASVADYLVGNGKISGIVHSALTMPQHPPMLVGVEDPKLYSQNVDAYRDAAPLMQDNSRRLLSLETRLMKMGRASLNPDLARFDSFVRGYQEQETQIGPYLETLGQYSLLPIHLSQFLKAVRWEKAIDTPRVEAERAALLNALSPKLTQVEISALIQEGIAYRLSTLSPSDFYRHLSKLAIEKGTPLENYPALHNYVEYVLLTDEINGGAIFKEMKAQEDTIYRLLTKSPAEGRIIAQLKLTRYARKLLSFSLSSDEWEEYQRLKNSVSLPPLKDLDQFESFYVIAEKRNQAMAKHLVEAAGKKESSVGLLVAGGFHAAGLASLLNEAGFTTISFVPKITKVADAAGNNYLSVFTQEKTPLEKLAMGEKLFLANDPAFDLRPEIMSTLTDIVRIGKEKLQASVEVENDRGNLPVLTTGKLELSPDPTKAPKLISVVSRVIMSPRFILLKTAQNIGALLLLFVKNIFVRRAALLIIITLGIGTGWATPALGQQVVYEAAPKNIEELNVVLERLKHGDVQVQIGDKIFTTFEELDKERERLGLGWLHLTKWKNQPSLVDDDAKRSHSQHLVFPQAGEPTQKDPRIKKWEELPKIQDAHAGWTKVNLAPVLAANTIPMPREVTAPAPTRSVGPAPRIVAPNELGPKPREVTPKPKMIAAATVEIPERIEPALTFSDRVQDGIDEMPRWKMVGILSLPIALLFFVCAMFVSLARLTRASNRLNAEFAFVDMFEEPPFAEPVISQPHRLLRFIRKTAPYQIAVVLLATLFSVAIAQEPNWRGFQLPNGTGDERWKGNQFPRDAEGIDRRFPNQNSMPAPVPPPAAITPKSEPMKPIEENAAPPQASKIQAASPSDEKKPEGLDGEEDDAEPGTTSADEYRKQLEKLNADLETLSEDFDSVMQAKVSKDSSKYFAQKINGKSNYFEKDEKTAGGWKNVLPQAPQQIESEKTTIGKKIAKVQEKLLVAKEIENAKKVVKSRKSLEPPPSNEKNKNTEPKVKPTEKIEQAPAASAPKDSVEPSGQESKSFPFMWGSGIFLGLLALLRFVFFKKTKQETPHGAAGEIPFALPVLDDSVSPAVKTANRTFVVPQKPARHFAPRRLLMAAATMLMLACGGWGIVSGQSLPSLKDMATNPAAKIEEAPRAPPVKIEESPQIQELKTELAKLEASYKKIEADQTLDEYKKDVRDKELKTLTVQIKAMESFLESEKSIDEARKKLEALTEALAKLDIDFDAKMDEVIAKESNKDKYFVQNINGKRNYFIKDPATPSGFQAIQPPDPAEVAAKKAAIESEMKILQEKLLDARDQKNSTKIGGPGVKPTDVGAELANGKLRQRDLENGKSDDRINKLAQEEKDTRLQWNKNDREDIEGKIAALQNENSKEGTKPANQNNRIPTWFYGVIGGAAFMLLLLVRGIILKVKSVRAKGRRVAASTAKKLATATAVVAAIFSIGAQSPGAELGGGHISVNQVGGMIIDFAEKNVSLLFGFGVGIAHVLAYQLSRAGEPANRKLILNLLFIPTGVVLLSLSELNIFVQVLSMGGMYLLLHLNPLFKNIFHKRLMMSSFVIGLLIGAPSLVYSIVLASAGALSLSAVGAADFTRFLGPDSPAQTTAEAISSEKKDEKGSGDKAQTNRQEKKYLVPYSNIANVRKFLLEHMQYDEQYIRQREKYPNGYPVVSDYLENVNPHHRHYLHTYYDREDKQIVRFKARARLYHDSDKKIFLEIKNRVGNNFGKPRAPVWREHYGDILNKVYDPKFLASKTDRERAAHDAALREFIGVVEKYHLKPFIKISYERMAFETFDKPQEMGGKVIYRANIDTHVRWSPVRSDTTEITTLADKHYLTYPNNAVVEFKYVGSPPDWWTDAVYKFGLQEVDFHAKEWGASKYADSVSIWKKLRPDARGDRLYLYEPASSFMNLEDYILAKTGELEELVKYFPGATIEPIVLDHPQLGEFEGIFPIASDRDYEPFEGMQNPLEGLQDYDEDFRGPRLADETTISEAPGIEETENNSVLPFNTHLLSVILAVITESVLAPPQNPFWFYLMLYVSFKVTIFVLQILHEAVHLCAAGLLAGLTLRKRFVKIFSSIKFGNRTALAAFLRGQDNKATVRIPSSINSNQVKRAGLTLHVILALASLPLVAAGLAFSLNPLLLLGAVLLVSNLAMLISNIFHPGATDLKPKFTFHFNRRTFMVTIALVIFLLPYIFPGAAFAAEGDFSLDSLLSSGNVGFIPLNLGNGLTILKGLTRAYMYGIALAYLYKKTPRGSAADPDVVGSLEAFPSVIASMMVILQGNIIPASMGLLMVFGVMSVRVMLRSLYEQVHLIFAIIVGMAFGTGKFEIGIAIAIFSLVLLDLIYWAGHGLRRESDIVLKVVWSRTKEELDELYQVIKDWSYEYSMHPDTKLQENGDSYLQFLVKLNSPSSVNEFVDTLEGRPHDPEMRTVPGVRQATAIPRKATGGTGLFYGIFKAFGLFLLWFFPISMDRAAQDSERKKKPMDFRVWVNLKRRRFLSLVVFIALGIFNVAVSAPVMFGGGDGAAQVSAQTVNQTPRWPGEIVWVTPSRYRQFQEGEMAVIIKTVDPAVRQAQIRKLLAQMEIDKQTQLQAYEKMTRDRKVLKLDEMKVKMGLWSARMNIFTSYLDLAKLRLQYVSDLAVMDTKFLQRAQALQRLTPSVDMVGFSHQQTDGWSHDIQYGSEVGGATRKGRSVTAGINNQSTIGSGSGTSFQRRTDKLDPLRNFTQTGKSQDQGQSFSRGSKIDMTNSLENERSWKESTAEKFGESGSVSHGVTFAVWPTRADAERVIEYIEAIDADNAKLAAEVDELKHLMPLYDRLTEMRNEIGKDEEALAKLLEEVPERDLQEPDWLAMIKANEDKNLAEIEIVENETPVYHIVRVPYGGSVDFMDIAPRMNVTTASVLFKNTKEPDTIIVRFREPVNFDVKVGMPVKITSRDNSHVSDIGTISWINPDLQTAWSRVEDAGRAPDTRNKDLDYFLEVRVSLPENSQLRDKLKANRPMDAELNPKTLGQVLGLSEGYKQQPPSTPVTPKNEILSEVKNDGAPAALLPGSLAGHRWSVELATKLPFMTEKNHQSSGLTMDDGGILYTIDDHSMTVTAFKVEKGKIKVERTIDISRWHQKGKGRLDGEGISWKSGSIFDFVFEGKPEEGGKTGHPSRLATGDLKSDEPEKFEVKITPFPMKYRNIEGVTRDGKGNLWAINQKDPIALLKIKTVDDKPVLKDGSIEIEKEFDLARLGVKKPGDLAFFDNNLYLLEKGKEPKIHQITTTGKLVETLHLKGLGLSSKAEGLAVVGDKIYVISERIDGEKHTVDFLVLKKQEKAGNGLPKIPGGLPALAIPLLLMDEFSDFSPIVLAGFFVALLWPFYTLARMAFGGSSRTSSRAPNTSAQGPMAELNRLLPEPAPLGVASLDRPLKWRPVEQIEKSRLIPVTSQDEQLVRQLLEGFSGLKVGLLMDRESQRAFDSIAQKYSGRVEILINEKSDNPLFVGLIGRRALNIDVLLSNLEKLSPIERSSYLIDLPYVTLRAPKGYSIQNSLLSDFNIEFIDATLGVAPLAIETVETLIQSAQISNENA